MKNMVLKGSIILVIAGLVGKALGAIYRIPLSNILGAEGIGIYQMIFPVFSLAIIICSGGVSVTVAHTIAKIRASGNGNEKKVFFQGFFFSLITSLAFGLAFYFLGDNISAIQGNSLAGAGYKMVAVALVFSSLLASFRGLFQGYQNMLPTASSQIIEQVFKVVFGLVFAYFFVDRSVELGVVGAFLGISIAEIFAFLYLIFRARKLKLSKQDNSQFESRFMLTNFSITLSFLIIPIITAFDSFVVINILKNFFSSQMATSLYGLQSGMINSLINFPVVISVAISLAILPDLSFIISQKDTASASEKIRKVYSFLLLILAPFVLVFVFFAGDIMQVLYPSLSAELMQISKTLLQISAFEILFIGLLQISTTIFQSLDKPAIPIYILIFAGSIKVALTLILVAMPEFNIMGLAISNLVFYGLASVLSLLLVKKYLPFSLKLKSLIVGGTALSLTALSFYVVGVYFTELWAKITIAGLCGVFLYLLPVLMFDLFEINHIIKQKFLRKEIKNE